MLLFLGSSIVNRCGCKLFIAESKLRLSLSLAAQVHHASFQQWASFKVLVLLTDVVAKLKLSL